MKSLLIALTAGAALTAGLASAASAAPGGYGPPNHAPAYGAPHHGGQQYGPDRGPVRAPAWISINQRQAALERQIEFGLRNGALSRREGFQLRAEFRNLQHLEARYRQGGLTRWEMSDLDRRMDGLSNRIRYAMRDADRRYGHGYGQGQGQGYGQGYGHGPRR
ncbi:hypothetical protein [Phenylobacterium sp.]|uniref:hypothetical protein n=1 Tax=Phenylobacterium sp. TaxID=1871053 RepID=UPI002731ADBF|nr:hypothetical protein [Phenylobacterium sp.]MDP1872761.1 hypothetical protein [Phenylobacterium sp.]MDP3489956.1 hypothetical protein [Phenylobacterium sp.]